MMCCDHVIACCMLIFVVMLQEPSIEVVVDEMNDKHEEVFMDVLRVLIEMPLSSESEFAALSLVSSTASRTPLLPSTIATSIQHTTLVG